MWRVALAIFFAAQITFAQATPRQSGVQDQPPPPASPPSTTTIIVPAGTSVQLFLTAPLWAKSAKPGDDVYAQTSFPVVVDKELAIPSGTYVQGRIDSLSRPGLVSPHAALQFEFTKIIFATGYTVLLPSVPPEAQTADDVIPAVATPYIEVRRTNDVLLDNGAQFPMILQLPLALDATQVAAALRQSSPSQLAQFKSATLCRPVPATPGTPGTIIPGTPGTPGTPDIVIPGGPGMPPTTIPGTPPTPGTPDTVIPGTPGFPGRACPPPAMVVPDSKPQEYRGAFVLAAAAQLAGHELPPGNYEVAWKGLGPSASIEIFQNGKVVANAQTRVLVLNKQSAESLVQTRTNADGSASLESLRLAGQSLALYFD